jgi:hypothetical protein
METPLESTPETMAAPTPVDIVRKRLRALLEDKTSNIKAAHVAKAIGMSAATVSTWLNHSYKGDAGGVEEKIRQYLDLYADRKASKVRWVAKPEYIETLTSKIIFEKIQNFHFENQIGVITGNAGVGKSTSAREYAKKTVGVIYLECDKTFTTKVLFQYLNRQCGGSGVGAIADMFAEILNKLRDTGRLLIIDQAEFLSEKSLDLLRTINDKAHVGVILMGLPRLFYILRGKRGENEYLFTRVSSHWRLDETQPEDVQAIVNAILPSINGLWKEFYANARSFADGNENGKANARTLCHLVSSTIKMANLNNVAITPELIRTAAQTLVR